MEALKAASLELAREALVPPNAFDPTSRSLTLRLENVLGVLKSLPPESITANVSEYVYFPLHSLLQQSKLGARPTELLLRILTILISTAWRNKAVFDLQKAQQLTAITTYLLSPEPPSLSQNDPLGPSKVFLESPTSLHASGFECLNALFQSAALCGFGPELGRAPTMANIIAILLTGLQYDTNDLESQKQSILALTTVLRDIIVNPDHRALVLPRIASKIAKFVAQPNRKHYSVKSLAILCLQELLCGCLSDSSFQKNDGPSRIRTSEWIQKTAEPLGQTFQVLQNLMVAVQSNQSSRPELIESLFTFAAAVYSQCAQTLQQASGTCIDTLLEMLLLCASQTINLDVAKKADVFIQQSDLAPKQLETGLVKQVKALPSAFDSTDEDRAILLLRSLQKSLAYVGSPEAHEAVLDSIVGALPLSVVRNSKPNTSPKQIQAIAKYKHQTNKMVVLSDLGLSLPLPTATQDHIYQVISEIGKTRGMETVMRLCDNLQLLRTRGRGSLDGTLTLWCVAAIVRNMPRESDVYDIIAYCYEEITNSMDIQSSSAIDFSPARYAHTALCCYVIGEVALNQGLSFEEHLVDLLHPIFSMLGDSQNIYVRQEAQNAISKVAFACGYESPAALALANKDYLVDGISTQLNTMNFTPGTPSALATLIYVSGSPIIPYLDDVFSSLFVLLDHYHGYSQLVKSILLVFGSLTSVIDKSIALPQAIADTAAAKKNNFIPSFAELLAELERKPEIDPSILEKKVDLNELASKKITEVTENDIHEDINEQKESEEESIESDNNDSDDEPQDLAEQTGDKWESPIAKPIYETLEKIASYCDKFMTHEASEIRLAVLSLLNKLTPYLALNNERFLPLVHKTWPEAIARVFDSEVYVIEEGLRCLSIITMNARDFVSSRIDGLWPKLSKSFGQLFRSRWPQFSNERRTQVALVQFLIAIFVSLPDISLITVDSMLRVVRPALLRGEFPQLMATLQTKCGPNVQDLTWLVMQQEKVSAVNEKYHSIMPIYSF